MAVWCQNQPAFAHETDHSAHGGQGESAPTPIPIGGPFTLTDQHGKQVKESDFRGKLMLVFFGFTHCPDICPVTVSIMSKLMPLLGNNAETLAPIFITVDPNRDTMAKMKDYLAPFDKRIVGLTGSPDAIKKAADAYKVYFSVAEASKKQTGDYMVNHSSLVFLMDKDGKYLKHFPYNASEQELAAAINDALK